MKHCRFEGNFSKSSKSGQGKLVMLNGDKYEGEWKNDEMNGEG
jgi:hypothetical protein